MATKTKLALATAIVAIVGAGVAAVLGACSDPFDSDGYLAGDGGGEVDGGGGGSTDATTGTSGPEAGDGGGGGGESGPPGGGDSGIGITSVDGITDTSCSPKSCAAQGIACGDASDQCGRQLDCGGCHHFGDVCTGGACGCTPKTAPADCQGGTLCGLVPDGCSGFFACPECGTNLHCGPDNTCSANTCAPTGDYENACGTISDGCGSTRMPANGNNCPENNPNNGCDLGPVPYACGCYGSSCAQQGIACLPPDSGPIDDLCQDANLNCSSCTYPPGQCNGKSRQCNTCTRVAGPTWPWDTQCQETALTEAWACDCVDGGACVVPDGAYAKAPVQTCKQLTNTSAHAIYCCKSQD